MITLIAVAALAIVALMALVLAVALLMGFVVGAIENLTWLWNRLHGGSKAPPWQRSKRPAYNRVPVAAEVRARVMARDGFRCVYCDAERDLTVDHVTPRVLGGSNDPSNLVTACRTCNSRKGPRTARGAHASVRRDIFIARRAGRLLARNGRH